VVGGDQFSILDRDDVTSSAGSLDEVAACLDLDVAIDRDVSFAAADIFRCS
jgi:hypothetical protein